MHLSFLNVTLIPNFLTIRIAARTSSEISKFCAFDKPFEREASNTHLILILLSPLTSIFLSNSFIFFFDGYQVGH